MSRKDTFYEKNSLFVNAALIANHANNTAIDFRQKDIRFFIELLSNWMETEMEGHCLDVQNTQVQRILDQLTNEGVLNRKVILGKPHYSFTSTGLLQIISRLVSGNSCEDMQSFFFLYHFVTLYSDKMQDLLLNNKNNFRKSYTIEIKHLLDPQILIQTQKRKIILNIEKLEARITDAKEMTKASRKMLAKGMNTDAIIKEIESIYPYQLNNQRKMTELFKSFSPDIRLLEITEAPEFRAKTLWEPLIEHYRTYLKNLENLEELQCN